MAENPLHWFLNKLNSMVMGQDGWDRWKFGSKCLVEKKIAIASDAAKEESLIWTARMSTMTITNDVIGPQMAFENPTNASLGIGEALAEQQPKDNSDLSWFYDDTFEPAPSDHSFSMFCMWQLVEEV